MYVYAQCVYTHTHTHTHTHTQEYHYTLVSEGVTKPENSAIRSEKELRAKEGVAHLNRRRVPEKSERPVA